MTKLSTAAVQDVLMMCLFREGEDTSNAVMVEGVTRNFGFHPDRLAENKEVIAEMLAQLPTEFHANGGGGYSFLEACNDRDGVQWTSFHRSMEELFVLGIAIKRAAFVLPRNMWNVLPGGMPYIIVYDADQEVPA